VIAANESARTAPRIRGANREQNMRSTQRFLCTLCLSVTITDRIAAQQNDTTTNQPKPQTQPASPQPQQAPPTVEQLQKRIDDLEKTHEQEMKDLRDELDDMADEAAKARAKSQTPQTQSASAFNPGITVFGNFLGRVDSKAVFFDDDPTQPRVDDSFLLREVELDFRAAIDPWADGVVIGTFEQTAPGEFTTGIEEGYVLMKKLPFLDEAPAGLKLKVGRFRPSFGRFNTIHLHDLPEVSYPRALQNFLGPEGFIADGVSGEFFLPSPSDKDTLDATIQVISGGNIAVDPSSQLSDVAGVGHVKWFRDLAPGHDLELGVSAWSSGSAHQLYGLDATYRWKPYVAGEWKSFLVGGELYQANLDDQALAPHPFGFDVWSQYQLAQNLYFGVRYDWLEELQNESEKTQTIGAFLTYYTTEFLRFRLGYEHTESDVANLDGLNSVFFELNFVYGSHPTEPYWVNR
jgi:hypothetical protein